MNRLKLRLRIVTMLLLLLLTTLSGFFVYTVYSNGTRWYQSGYNTRLSADTDYVVEGALRDRDGVVLASSDAPNRRTYTEDGTLRLACGQLYGDSLGMTSVGLEQRFSRVLYGEERGFLSKLIETVEDGTIRGQDVYLTIDADVEKAAYNAMDGRSGAVAVMNYRTGEVIANVSLPTFDVASLTEDTAREAPAGTFLNKVLQGKYPPGSIFKIVTASALIGQGDLYVDFDCTGENQLPGVVVNCYGGTVHGPVDLTSAFKNSCNGAFAMWGLEKLNADSITETAEEFGFNDTFLFPDCTVYDSAFVKPDDAYDLAWACVGQSETILTPLHAVMIASAVANDGVMMTPRYLHATADPEKDPKTVGEKTYTRALSEETAAVVEELMANAVSGGTAGAAAVDGWRVCGKTGTAEVDNEEPHAWFVGYIDSETAPYAVAVIVEHAGSGGAVAAPVAGAVLRACVEDL